MKSETSGVMVRKAWTLEAWNKGTQARQQWCFGSVVDGAWVMLLSWALM